MKNVVGNYYFQNFLMENLILKCRIAHANFYCMSVNGFDYWHGKVEKAEFTDDGLLQIEYSFGDVFKYEFRNNEAYSFIHVREKEKLFKTLSNYL